MIKSDGKDVYSIMLEQFYISNKCCLFEHSIHQRIPKKNKNSNASVSENKIFRIITVFNIANNQKCFLNMKIKLNTISEDHLTLKTGGMKLKIDVILN